MSLTAQRTPTPETTPLRVRPRPRPRGLLTRHVDEYWPLLGYAYLYPVWWLLGVSKVILFVFTVPMVWTLLSRRRLRVPQGFGLYALFLVWVVLGATMLWVRAPGTEPKAGFGPLIAYTYRGFWYAAITIACLYILNADRTRLTATRVIRMFGYLFVITTIGGLAGVLVPNLDFPSAIELVLPRSVTSSEFMNALFHPRIALQSEFLGYTQPRVTAPFSYPNTWGNAYGLLLPFFLVAWFGAKAGWRRWVGPVIVLASLVPVVYSLNRGLWMGLGVTIAWVALRRVLDGDLRLVLGAALAAVALMVGLAATPLGTTVSTRVSTPHSDERREDSMVLVFRATWESSPVLGYGGTRQVIGNYSSIAGSGTPDCERCTPPPLGTQGFLWGLIFMTGFVGAALMMSFLAWQAWLNARRSTTLGLLSSAVLVASMFYFLFYDALDLPMLVTMCTIGLSAREHAPRPSPASGARHGGPIPFGSGS